MLKSLRWLLKTFHLLPIHFSCSIYCILLNVKVKTFFFIFGYINGLNSFDIFNLTYNEILKNRLYLLFSKYSYDIIFLIFSIRYSFILRLLAPLKVKNNFAPTPYPMRDELQRVSIIS